MADPAPCRQNGSMAAAGRIDVKDPAKNKRIASPALADAADVERAVQATRRVHLAGALSALRPIERGRMVQAMWRYLLEHKDAIAQLLTLEQGRPHWESHIEVEGAALYFEYYGDQASTVEGCSIPRRATPPCLSGVRERMVCRRRRNAFRRLRQIGLRPRKGARGALEFRETKNVAIRRKG